MVALTVLVQNFEGIMENAVNEWLEGALIIAFATLGAAIWHSFLNENRYHKYPNPPAWMLLHTMIVVGFALFGYWLAKTL